MRLFLEVITYLLDTFICCDKLFTFVLPFMSCGFLTISSKSVDCNLFIYLFSFMFDDLDMVNLALRHICLCCVILKPKNENKWCFEKLYCVSFKFMRCFVCICNDTLIGLFGMSRILIPKGNKLENIHDNKVGLLYSFIILDQWLKDRYWWLLKLCNVFIICSCWFMFIPS